MDNNKNSTFHSIRNGLIWIPLIFGIILAAGTASITQLSTEQPGSFISSIIAVLLLILLPLTLLHYWNKDVPNKFTPPVWLIVTVSCIALIIMMYGTYKQTHTYFIWQDEQIEKSLSDVNTSYQKRFNVVTNTAKATASFTENEKEILTRIADARNQFQGAGSMNNKVEAINEFDGAIKAVVTNVESYPNLASSELYLTLIDTIIQSETEVADAKLRYNDQARLFNSYSRSIPYSFMVGSIVEETRKIYLDEQVSEEVKDATKLLDALD